MMQPYFANLEGADLTNALIERVRDYQRHIIASGYFALGVEAVRYVVGMDAKGYTSFELKKHGPRGEYAKFKVDEIGSLFSNLKATLTGQKIVFEPQPRGEGWQASEQARRAKGVLRDGLHKGMEKVLLTSVDTMLQMGMAVTAVDFDPDGGEPTMPGVDGAPPIMSGAMSTRSYMPQDAAFDIESRGPDEPTWWILRRWVNAHDLLARFPEREDTIQRALGGSRLEHEVEIQRLLLHHMPEKLYRYKVPLYEFRHAATPACPNGKLAWFLNIGEPPLFVDDLPFVDEEGQHRMCVERLALMDIKGTAFGFTPLWWLMAPQQVLDMLESIEASVYRTHGLPVILNPRGSNITPKKIGTGFAVIDFTPGHEPKALNLSALPPDLPGAQQRKVDTMQRLLGVSPVDRGDPPANLKSGSALLFVKATTAQNQQPHLNTVATHHERVAEDYLFLFWLFAQQPQRIQVLGELSERTEEVSGADIGGPLRVKVELGNPITHSIAGQIQIAENLLAQKAIAADQYVEIVDGAGIEKLLKQSSSQRILVEQENAMLRRGDVPLVSPTDNHPYHMRNHALELNSQQARADPTVLNAVLQHLADHQRQWAIASIQNPGLLEALGILPMQAALGALQASMGGMPPGDGGQEGGATPAPALPPGGPMEGPPDGGQMPRPPRLPPGTAAATGVNPAAPGPGGGQ